MPEALTVANSRSSKPITVGSRPVSVIGWLIAVLAGLSIWIVAYLLVR